MRLLLAAAVLLHSARAADVGMNQPCNKDLDGLLASDPNGSEHTFLSCVGVGVGNIAFWERKICPNDMVFDFINQQCKAKRKKSRKQQTLNIAILNNSCANGETCIGGTVCDLDILRCLCPFGTIPQVETLSCVKNDVTPAFNFNSFNFENSDFFKPNPSYQKTVTSYTPDQGYSGSSSSWQPYPQQPNNFNGGGDFKPNQFVFNMFTTTMAPPPTPKVPILAYPGQSCKDEEICSGGSICTLPIGLCLCPGELEARDGECVLPASAAIQITREPAPIPTYPPRTVPPVTRPPPTYLPPTLPAQPVQVYRPAPTAAPAPPPSTINYQTIVTPPPRPIVKSNQMKINLGGSKQAGVGVRCALNTDCMIGAYCNGNTNPPSCQCLSTHVNIEGRCEKNCNPACPAPLMCVKSKCVEAKRRRARQLSSLICYPDSKSCSHGDGVCLAGECRCLRGWQPRDGACRPIEVPIGASCTGQETVCQSDAVCDSGICRCRYPDTCAQLEGSCTENSDCQSGEHCSNGKCVCASENCATSIPAPVVYKSLNSACWGNDRCSGGSVCKDSVCQCTDGASELHGRCQQQPGGRCSSGQTCSSGSVCDFGLCRCQDGFSLVNGVCHMTASPPGKSCQLGQQCLHGSACRFGVCMCIGKTITLGGKCVRRQELAVKIAEVLPGTLKGPGRECKSKDLCTGGSRCVDGYCECEDFETIIDDQCVGSRDQAAVAIENLQVAAPGQPCEARTNCTGGSLCIDRKCQCEQGTMSEDGGCSRTTPSASPTKKSGRESMVPGSLCTLTLECPFRTECTRGVCRCKKGETIVEGTCRTAIHQVFPGGKCDPRNGYDCVGESHCIYGVCSCVRQLINNGKLCVTATEITIIPIGKRCTPELICAGGSRCLNGYCRCRGDEVPDVNGKCVKKSSVYPVFNKFVGSTTTSPEDRFKSKIDEIEELELEIKNNPMASLGESRPNAVTLEVIYGSPCSTNDDCPNNSFCQYSQCQCIPGFRATGGYCERVQKAGEECSSTNQCETNAFCLNGKCICSSRDGRTCSAPDLRRPGEECGEGRICAFNSYCGIMSGVCECPSGMSTQDAVCQQTAVKPGMACVTSRNCHKYSYCDNGYCLCKTGFNLVEGFCVPLSGGQDRLLPPDRNDGPQSPMQERIRTESYMKLNPAGSGVSGSEQGTAYEFGAGRVQGFNPYGQNGMEAERNYESGRQEQALNRYGGQAGSEYGSEKNGRQFNSFGQTMTVTHSSVKSEGTPYEFGPIRGHNYPENYHEDIEDDFDPSPPSITQKPVKIVLPVGSNPDIFSAPGVQTPFVFQPFPFARGANTKSGDQPTSVTTTVVPKVRVAMPGEYCADGSICLGNSVCKGQFCRCPIGASAENGICTQRKRLHPLAKPQNNAVQEDEEERVEQRQFSAPLENCQNFEYCTAGSECLNIHGMGLICQCPMEMIFLEEECVDTPKRAELAGIGDSCSQGEICLGGSTCLKGVCVCGDGKREILGICVQTAQPGDDCGRGETCVDGSICVGEFRTCVCPPGKASKLGRCVEDLDSLAMTTGAANPGENCDSHVVCMDNSFCDGKGRCACLPKFKNVRGRCVPASMVRLIGEPCPPGTICSGGACANGICSCREGQIEIEGVCVEVPSKIRKVRSVCKSGENCDENLLLNSDTECEETCPGNSSCQEGICICDDGYRREMDVCVERHPHTDEHFPIWKQIFGKKTVSGDQVEEGWTHKEFTSQKEKSKIPWTDKLTVTTIPWVAKARATTPLPSEDQDFGSITLSERLPTVTRARVPFLRKKTTVGRPRRPNNKLPFVYVGPGASCVGKRKCSEGSICFDGNCVCGYEDEPINDECVPRDGMVRFGHRCSENHSCLPGLVCVFNRCQCPFGDQYCDPNEPVTSPPGGSCTEARECTGGSVCREGWCICPDPTMIVQKGICIQSGPRPTLPSRTVPVYTTPSPPLYHPTAPSPTPGRIFQAIPSPQQAARKRTPGSQCGPLDTCVGGSTCVESLCVCPAGMQPSMHGRCEAAATSAPAVSSSQYARPGESCSHGQVCTGGATCSHAQMCDCPPEKPLIKNEFCHAEVATRRQAVAGESCDSNTDCVNSSFCHTGQCRCPPQNVAVSGHCIPMPMPTTPAMKVFSKPLESCDDGEVCSGGSKCDEDTGICMCPPGQIAFGEQCKPPPTPAPATITTLKPTPSPFRVTQPTVECTTDSQCQSGRTCMGGKCRCRPGTVDHAGVCEPLEEIEAGERPIPISYARHRALSEPRVNSTERVSQLAMSPSERPRVVGPPIRRPKPKSKGSSVGSGAAGIGNNGSGNYKTGGSGAGNCPPGNEATRDGSGKLVICNGLEPNCPPRSYCYITSGGFATEEYNCCKSW